MNSNLSRRMQQLFEEMKGLDALGELEHLEKRISDESDQALVVQMSITKASILAELGKVQEALQILDDCSRSPNGDESASYFAAEILVKRQRYAEAEDFLEKAEQHIARNRSTYYSNCIHLLHAYCAAKLGNFEKSKQLLDRMLDVDGDEEMLWLSVSPLISISMVRQLIVEGRRGS